ncbi:MAG: HEAT repeat domain-containing protein [Bryobacteraceae bacterium]
MRNTVKRLVFAAAMLALAVMWADNRLRPLGGAGRRLPPPSEVLQGSGVELTPAGLIAALSNENPFIRQAAAAVLGERKIESAKPALIARLRDKNETTDTRIAAAGALLDMGDTTGEPVLLDLTAGSDARIAVDAACVLAQHGNAAGFDAVVRIAKTSADPVFGRQIAAHALSTFAKFPGKRKAVVDTLSSLLVKDADADVRLVAAAELMNFRGEEADRAFARALHDSDPVIRGVAEVYLDRSSRK